MNDAGPRAVVWVCAGEHQGPLEVPKLDGLELRGVTGAAADVVVRGDPPVRSVVSSRGIPDSEWLRLSALTLSGGGSASIVGDRLDVRDVLLDAGLRLDVAETLFVARVVGEHGSLDLRSVAGSHTGVAGVDLTVHDLALPDVHVLLSGRDNAHLARVRLLTNEDYRGLSVTVLGNGVPLGPTVHLREIELGPSEQQLGRGVDILATNLEDCPSADACGATILLEGLHISDVTSVYPVVRAIGGTAPGDTPRSERFQLLLERGTVTNVRVSSGASTSDGAAVRVGWPFRASLRDVTVRDNHPRDFSGCDTTYATSASGRVSPDSRCP